MIEPTAYPVIVRGQASVPEDIIIDIDVEHSDPSSLWIGLQPPTGQEAVTLWDGSTMTGPLPTHYIDRHIYRDDMVNGEYQLLVQNVGGRGEGVLRTWSITVTSRFD
jgi:subtilisin-like proprotein convertase family protein